MYIFVTALVVSSKRSCNLHQEKWLNIVNKRKMILILAKSVEIYIYIYVHV